MPIKDISKISEIAGKSVTIADIARDVGVSKNAVSLALRNSASISKATTKKIAEAANRLGYKRSEIVSEVMSRMRAPAGTRFFGTIALLNANEKRDAFKNHFTIPEYVAGVYRAAQREGFAVDEFWLYDKSLSAKSLQHIMESRGIKGGIIVGLMRTNKLPPRFRNIWKNFKFVVTGVRTYSPTLDFVCADHFLIGYQAVINALKLGYKRPALVLDEVIDNLIQGRFTGGFLKAQFEIPKKNRTEPFFDITGARKNIDVFYKWFRENKPDVIITLYNSPRTWLEKIGVFAPRDIGLIQLDRRKCEPEWTGINQNSDVVGEAAVEHLSKLLRRPNFSEKAPMQATIIAPDWIESETTRKE